MLLLKKNKLPKLYLKLNHYKIKSDNEYVTEYRKTIILKDKYHYPISYFIHIFYHKKDINSEVCVSNKFYSQEYEDWRYEWFTGNLEEKSIEYIEAFDKKLLKYIEKVEEER